MTDVQTWKKRQELHYKVRSFFLKRGLLEVDVPVLSSASGTDPQLDYFETLDKKYLATSPEFFMKRLLANGYSDIFSLTHAFRRGESGERHNCEFNIAEWYRVGFSVEDLQREVLDLVNEITGFNLSFNRISWKDAFKNVDMQTLKSQFPNWTLEEIEDYAMTTIIEPNLKADFIVDYPPERAALAQVNNGVAERFELYVNGVELCNGYLELLDADEQKKRFLEDLEKRKKMNKSLPNIDENFLQALEKGMPKCAGVALGLDRLYMLALGKNNINKVLLFGDNLA